MNYFYDNPKKIHDTTVKRKNKLLTYLPYLTISVARHTDISDFFRFSDDGESCNICELWKYTRIFSSAAVNSVAFLEK